MGRQGSLEHWTINQKVVSSNQVQPPWDHGTTHIVQDGDVLCPSDERTLVRKVQIDLVNLRADKVQICRSAPEQAVNPLFLSRH